MVLFCSTRIGRSIEGKVPSDTDEQYKIHGCISMSSESELKGTSL